MNEEKSRSQIHEESTKQADDLHDLEFDKQDKIHSSDISDRDEIHADDTLQIKNLSNKLDQHIKDNKAQFKVSKETGRINGENIKKLLPLADLAPTLNEIVENQKAFTYVGRKVLRIIGYIAAVVGLLIGLFELYKRVK